MTPASVSPFTNMIIDLGSGNELYIIDIDGISVGLKTYIDEKSVTICEGQSGNDLASVKVVVTKFLNSKKGSDIESGAIAEFFLHLFLNERNFKPQFLYLNLEEGSIKKGFDGYYLFNDLEWLLESKSGSILTAGISHKGKIKEAYKDLDQKFAGKSKNNPWRNAYNHASHIDVGADSNVRANIKKFSDQYVKAEYHHIENFNIIPGSTIFLDGTWTAPDIAQITADIKTLVASLKFKQIKVLCITKRSLNSFWDYLQTP